MAACCFVNSAAQRSLGASTNLLVVQDEAALAQSQSTEVVHLGTLVKSALALQRATGTILDVNGISLNEAYRGVVSTPPHPLPATTTPVPNAQSPPR